MKRLFETTTIFIVVIAMIVCDLISPNKSLDNDHFFYFDDEI